MRLNPFNQFDPLRTAPFDSRYDTKWSCAFTNLETGACSDPSS